MTLQEHLNMINAKREQINGVEDAKRIAEIEQREQLDTDIQKMRERIENVIAVGNALKKNGFIHDPGRKDKRLEKYGYPGEIVAEGINHHVGLIAPFYVKRKTEDYEYIGIIMGGACGKYNFYTNGTDILSTHEDTGRYQEPPITHLKQFVDEFPKYETALYAWIEDTMKI